MYPWLVFLHVIGVFGFLMSHGVSAGVALALRRERQFERVRVLLELSGGSYGVMYLSLLVLLVTGIITGFMAQWWGRGWIWVSLGLLIALSVAMWVIGSRFYSQVRQAVGLPWFDGLREHPAQDALSAEAVDALMSSSGSRPMLLTVIGFGGIAVIAWLMMFKPF